jgi:hypothetical protein
MAATDRFGLRSSRNARKSAHAWCHKAKTKAKPRAIRLHWLGQQDRVNSYDISSRVETNIVRRLHPSARLPSINTRGPYHYCSINPQRPNSENSWSICGNPETSDPADFRTPLINKHLDLFQNGPPVANCVSPARVLMYWCPETE